MGANSTPLNTHTGATPPLASGDLSADELDWRQITDPVERKKAHHRQWMRAKRAKTPKQQDAHICTWNSHNRMKTLWEVGGIKPSGHKWSDEQKKKMSERMKANPIQMSEYHREWSRKHAYAKLLPAAHKPEVYAKIWKSLKKSGKWKRSLKLAREGCKKSPKCQRSETHASAQELWLKSPSGKSYHAINAQHFVRTYKHLFNELDTVERMPTGVSRAAHGLRKLNPKIKSGYPVWKNWMWDYDGSAEAANAGSDKRNLAALR